MRGGQVESWNGQMPRSWFICGLLIFTLFAQVRRTDSQTNIAAAQRTGSYKFSVAVDEVSLIFHAEDIHGLPVNDLKLSELSLLDKGSSFVVRSGYYAPMH